MPKEPKNFFANEKNFFNKFWANVGLSFISKCLNKSKFSGEILDNKKGVTKNFCQTSSGNFSAWFKKFAPQNLNLMGITGSVSLNKNQFFIKIETFYVFKNFLSKFWANVGVKFY